MHTVVISIASPWCESGIPKNNQHFTQSSLDKNSNPTDFINCGFLSKRLVFPKVLPGKKSKVNEDQIFESEIYKYYVCSNMHFRRNLNSR